MSDTNGPTWERHTQTVLALLVTALLIWVGATTQSTSVTIAELKTEISFMRQERSNDQSRLTLIEREQNAVKIELAALRKEVEALRESLEPDSGD